MKETTPPLTYSASPTDIDYQALFSRMLRNWYWFVLAALIAGSLAYLDIRYATPKYATSATIIVEDPVEGPGVTTKAISQQFGFIEDSNIADEIILLKSRGLLAEVVEDLGLDVKYIYKGAIRDVDIYNGKDLRVRRLDSLIPTSQTIEYGAVSLLAYPNHKFSLVQQGDTSSYLPGTPFKIGNISYYLEIGPDYEKQVSKEVREVTISINDPQRVASGMLGNLGVVQIGASNTLSIVYSDTDPQRAVDVVNGIIKVYDRRTINGRGLEGAKTLEFIDDRLATVATELYNVEASVAGLKERENIVMDQASQGASLLDQINTVEGQKSELELRLSLIADVRRILNQPDDVYEPLSVASEVIDGTLGDLIREYNKLIFEREQKLEVATTANPLVITYSEQINELRRTLRQSINTIYRETSERITRINERIIPIENRVNRIPQNERRLLQILRDQQLKQNLFIFLMEKREEAALAIAGATPNTRIVDRAIVNNNPVYPKPVQIYVIAFALAIVIPMVIMFLLEFMNSKITSEEAVTRATNVPVIGRLPKSRDRGLVIARKSNSIGAEMFRLLRTSVSFMLSSTPDSKVILVTSSVSGEGKTFIASNLAMSFALTKKKTIVVGADLRKPTLGNILIANRDQTEKPGLSSYLVGSATVDDILRPTEDEYLTVISSGPIPPDPSELLLSHRTEELIASLKQRFDVILIDTPPIGLVTDALLLRKYVDLSLFIVRIGVTPKNSLQLMADASTNEYLPQPHLVLNDVTSMDGLVYGKSDYYK